MATVSPDVGRSARDSIDAAITDQQIATAHNLLFQADTFGRRIADTIDHHAVTGEPWDVVTRVRCRNDAARAVALSYDVCEIVGRASGANSRRHTDPLVRILRDIDVLAVHSFHLEGTATEEYGRVLVGKEPSFPVY